MLGKKNELVERPENEPKFDSTNKTDRNIVLTLSIVGLVAVILTVVVIILVRNFM